MRFILSSLILLSILSCGKESPVVADPVISFTLTVTSGVGGSVSSTGGSYNEGQSVSITAIPDSEYVFVNWSNGSTDNPISITVNSNQTITANFVKRKYPLTISITGSGTVSEEIISSGKTTTEYNSGSVIRLTANPSGGWEFSGWSNGLSDPTISINIDSNLSLTANFSLITHSFFENLSELNKGTSWFKTNSTFNHWYYENIDYVFDNMLYILESNNQLRFGGNTSSGNETGTTNESYDYIWKRDSVSSLFSDLNNDGTPELYLHYVLFSDPETPNFNVNTDRNSLLIKISDFNTFRMTEPNIDNVEIFQTRDLIRKIVLIDFDNDSNDDLLFLSTGKDADPFPGDFNTLFNTQTSNQIDLDSELGFFHGGATGDYDNDGDVDIVAYSGYSQHPVRPVLFQNQSGQFNSNNSIFLNFNSSANFYTVELFDINKDGYLDLFLGGGSTSLNDDLILIYGNSEYTFDYNNKISLPVVTNYGPIDVDFFDFNGDGNIDLLVNSIYDESPGNSKIEVIINDNGAFSEETNDYFQVPYPFEDVNNGGAIFWLSIKDLDYDGDLDILGDATSGNFFRWGNNKIWFENIEGRFHFRTQAYRN